MQIVPQTKLWPKVIFVGLFSRSMWRTAIRDALSRRYGFAMTWVQSQWNTQRGDNRSTALSLLWVALYVSSSLSLSLSLPNDIYLLCLCQICAIIGGTFTVAGIIDSCIFTASEAWKKIQIGKMSWVLKSTYHTFYLCQPNLCTLVITPYDPH